MRALILDDILTRPVSELPARERRILKLIGLTVLLGAADLILTIAYMRTTGLIESNPVVLHLVRYTGSASAIAFFKALTMLAGLGLIYHLRRHLQAEVAAWLVTAVFTGVVVAWHLYAGETANLDPIALAELARTEAGWVVLQ